MLSKKRPLPAISLQTTRKLSSSTIWLKTLSWIGRQGLHFQNKSELFVFYLKEAGYDLSRILYNSLATPFLTTMNLPNSGQDVLFWQEPITDSVPGNMRLLLESNHRQTKIVVQDYTAYTNLLKLVSPEQASRVAFLGFMYPFARQNNFQNQALILTNSDQIEHLESNCQWSA